MTNTSNMKKSCIVGSTRRFKRHCIKCLEVFKPIGKYQKLCEKCYIDRFRLRDSKFPTKCFKSIPSIKSTKRKGLNTLIV